MISARALMLLTELSMFNSWTNGPLQLDAIQVKFLRMAIHATITAKAQMLLMELSMYRLNLKLSIDHKINALILFSETQSLVIMKIPQVQMQSHLEKILQLESSLVEPQSPQHSHHINPLKQSQLQLQRLEVKRLRKEPKKQRQQ